jgi:hypothetical protein
LFIPKSLNAQIHILTEPAETEANIGKIVALSIDVNGPDIASG